MICISTRCPKYNECAATVAATGFECCEPFDSFGYGSISLEKSEFKYMCGPLGNYALFRPKNNSGYSEWSPVQGGKDE